MEKVLSQSSPIQTTCSVLCCKTRSLVGPIKTGVFTLHAISYHTNIAILKQ